MTLADFKSVVAFFTWNTSFLVARQEQSSRECLNKESEISDFIWLAI